MIDYKKVSIIIPVFNEEKTIQTVLSQVRDASTLGLEKEIILVDDYSTDGTKALLGQMKYPSIRIFYHETNLGKGAAIKTGLQNASGEIILIQDADLEYDPSDFPALLEPFNNSATQVVYGYRTTPGYKKYYLGNKIFTAFVNFLFGSDLKDPYTGYKVIKRDLMRSFNLENNGFEIEAEITSKLLMKKIKIIQVPISYNPRTFEKGKKIRFFKDGLRGLWVFLKYRFFAKIL